MRALGDCFMALVLALAFGAAGATAAGVQRYADALAHFTADTFDETSEGINAVAASGAPSAAPVLSALQGGRLLFSAQTKRVLIRDAFDELTDAATGQAVTPPPDDLAPVRLNNRLRRAVEAALGSLSLGAPDPQRRLEAAQAVLRSRDVNALPTLDRAIGKESDPRVKQG